MPLPQKKTEKELNYLKKIYLWYGIPKIGKTTTGANFGGEETDKILFFPTEPGHKFQEIYAWQTQAGKLPSSWTHWKECVKEIAKDDMGFKCIAVDTLDNLWKWCTIHMLNELGIEHESQMGFGRGYHAIRDEFFKPLNWLTQNGYGLIFMSHEATSERKHGPRTINYTDTTLPGTCRKLVHGICDYIFYFGADHDGNRFIRTKGNENYNAGDRSGVLPELIPMDAAELKKCLMVETPEEKMDNEKIEI